MMLDRGAGRDGIAEIRYDTPDFAILRRGSHVVCGLTGALIPLSELRYWSVALQQAFVGPGELIEATRRAGLL